MGSDYCRNGACRHAEGQAGGFAVGIYGGYNYQFANRFVIGGEFDWGKSTSSRDEHVFGDSALLSGFGAFGSARLRAGYAFDRLLAYGAIGVGVASIGNGYRYIVQKGCDTIEQVIWDEHVKAGLIAGGGFEYAFTRHFVGRGEYLYANYGTSRCPAGTAPALNSATRCISCASAPATGSDRSFESSGGDWLPDHHASPCVSGGMRRGDRLADRRERRAVVEFEVFTDPLQSEVAP